MCKFSREMNHSVQNYVSANLMLWTIKNCAKIVLILQCCNSALLGRLVFKNHTQVPKLIYFQSLLEVFAQDVTLGGCLSKYRRAFIVYMFRRPPEVWSLASDNASISGTSKAPMALTLNVRGPSYLGLTRSISWLLMPWLLTSPEHQQPWYWLCKIGRSLSYSRRNFNYLCLISVEEWHKM